MISLRSLLGSPAKKGIACLLVLLVTLRAAGEAQTTPLFPALRSDPMALSGASRRKRIPSSLLRLAFLERKRSFLGSFLSPVCHLFRLFSPRRHNPKL